MMKKAVFLFLLVSFTSCGVMVDDFFKWLGETDEKLTMEREPYQGNELRIDGYYYYMHEGDVYDTYFFYQNGVVIYNDELDFVDCEDPLAYLDSLFLSDGYSSGLDKYHYGVFLIDGDSIQIEKISYNRVILLSGNILNDTSFVLTKNENSNTGNVFHMNKLFQFHATTHKPDSTNTFIP